MASRNSDSDIPELYERRLNWGLIRLVAGAVVLALIIAFLIWFFFFRGDDVKAPSGTPPISQQAKNDHNINGGSSNSHNKKSSSHKGNNNQPGETELTNTGPGDVVAVFAGAVIIGALAYNFKLRRSASR